MSFGRAGSLGAGLGSPSIRVPPLLLDDFSGNGAVSGRVANIGPVWATTGPDASNMATLSGEMYQSAGTGAAYATSETVALIGEVGCKFRLGSVMNQMVIGGTPTTGKNVGAFIYASGESTSTLIFFATTTGQTTAQVATALAAEITANATMVSKGISATANGSTVSVIATEAPRIDVFGDAPVTNAAAMSAPTLAVWPTGENFATTMIHFNFLVSGICQWTLFVAGVNTTMQSLSTSAAARGFEQDVEYILRCCVDPPYVWGGVWQGATLITAAVGQDTRIATNRGASCFFETFLQNITFYKEAWAYRHPSVSRATVEAALP